MGYYTHYELELLKGEVTEELIQELENKDVIGYALEIDLTSCDESCKWYRHDKDMIDISKKFKEHIFKLSGEGEENGDIWVTYYKNGKLQHEKAKITFEEFDENKLVEKL